MKKFTVYLANNEVMKVHRNWYDWWFVESTNIMVFRDENNKRVRVSKHWIIKVVEV